MSGKNCYEKDVVFTPHLKVLFLIPTPKDKS